MNFLGYTFRCLQRAEVSDMGEPQEVSLRQQAMDSVALCWQRPILLTVHNGDGAVDLVVELRCGQPTAPGFVHAVFGFAVAFLPAHAVEFEEQIMREVRL